MASSGIEYKLFMGGVVADRALYDMVETVTVEQGIDLAAEARIELELCADDKGSWNGTSETYAASWQRVRVEVRNGASGWVPLIDGPVVERISEASSEPGTSLLTLVVRDDSIYLNQHAKVEVFERDTDAVVARKLLVTPPIVDADIDVDEIPDRPGDRELQLVRWGTEMELLHKIAEPYDLHVYVRPGATVKTSVGCLKKIDTNKHPTLPTLVLVGPDRNIETFHVRDEVGMAAVQATAQLDIDQLTVTHKRSKWTSLDLLGDQTAVDNTANLGTILISPIVAAFHAIDQVVDRLQQRNSYTVAATGTLRGGCYQGVLTPYDVVNVSGVDQKQCTKYVIKEVTHTLARSEYTQSFTLYTNAIATTDRGGNPVPAEIGLW